MPIKTQTRLTEEERAERRARDREYAQLAVEQVALGLKTEQLVALVVEL